MVVTSQLGINLPGWPAGLRLQDSSLGKRKRGTSTGYDDVVKHLDIHQAQRRFKF